MSSDVCHGFVELIPLDDCTLIAAGGRGGEMGGRKEVAEEIGWCSKQTGREDQRIGGCPETSFSAQRNTEQVFAGNVGWIDVVVQGNLPRILGHTKLFISFWYLPCKSGRAGGWFSGL